MQTLVNLSSSRDVLKQIEINQHALTRIQEYYKNYREALEFQLSVQSPVMIDMLSEYNNGFAYTGTSTASSAYNNSNNNNNNNSNVFSPSIAATPSVSANGGRPLTGRRKTIFSPTSNNSPFGGNQQQANSHAQDIAIGTAVIQLKSKVLGYNDR